MLMFFLFFILIAICEIITVKISITILTAPKDGQIFLCVFGNILGIIGVCSMLYYTLKFCQWVTIDEKGISTRNLVKKIHCREWNQIKEIKEAWISTNKRGGLALKYFILIDEREKAMPRDVIIRKNTYIIIPSNKKTKTIIEEFYSKEITKEKDF